MKKILLLTALTTMLAAADCPEKSKMYSEGYNAVTEQLKGYKDDPEKPGLKKVFISSFANSVCDTSCGIIAYENPSAESPRKKVKCLDICMKGAQDAFNGSKPKMKLCP